MSFQEPLPPQPGWFLTALMPEYKWKQSQIMFEGFKNLRTWLKQAWGCSCSCPRLCTSSSQGSLPAPPCYFTWVHTDPTFQQAQGRKRVVHEGHTSSVGALTPTQTHHYLCMLPP